MNLKTLAFIGMMSLFIGTIYYATERTARGMLESWAASQGYLLRSARTSFFGGPFWWERVRNRWVYKIVVQLPDGLTRQGHVLCGGFWWGLWVEKVKVCWD